MRKHTSDLKHLLIPTANLQGFFFLCKQNPYHPRRTYLLLGYFANIWGSPEDNDVCLNDQQIPSGADTAATPKPHIWQFETFCFISASTHQRFGNPKVQARKVLLHPIKKRPRCGRGVSVSPLFPRRHHGNGIVRNNQTDGPRYKRPSTMGGYDVKKHQVVAWGKVLTRSFMYLLIWLFLQ